MSEALVTYEIESTGIIANLNSYETAMQSHYDGFHYCTASTPIEDEQPIINIVGGDLDMANQRQNSDDREHNFLEKLLTLKIEGLREYCSSEFHHVDTKIELAKSEIVQKVEDAMKASEDAKKASNITKWGITITALLGVASLLCSIFMK